MCLGMAKGEVGWIMIIIFVPSRLSSEIDWAEMGWGLGVILFFLIR